jgi:hypothetical protein
LNDIRALRQQVDVPFPTLLEYDMSENALRTDLAKQLIRHTDSIVVSSRIT